MEVSKARDCKEESKEEVARTYHKIYSKSIFRQTNGNQFYDLVKLLHCSS